MKRLYSKSTGNTYLVGFHPVIPSDAVPIDEQRFQDVIANPSPHLVRAHDADGLPFLVEPRISLEDTHRIKTAEINAHCEAAITSGFWSAALGSAYMYSSELSDQLNLSGVVFAAQPSLYPCRDDQGLKEFRPHSAEQLKQVSDDFTAFKLQHLQLANALKQRLDQALAAEDVDALEAVAWEAEP